MKAKLAKTTEIDRVGLRHAQHYLRVVAAVSPQLRGD